jgi:hypothetical protein
MMYDVTESGEEYMVAVKDAAIFSNLIGFKKLFKKLKPGKKVVLNFAEAHIVDHTFMEQLHHFEGEYHHGGGTVAVTGFEYFQFFSNHPLATRKFSPGKTNKLEIRLNPRQIELRKFAESNDLIFYPQKIKNSMKFKNFPIEKGANILYEENILSKYTDFGKVEISDITLSQGAGMAQSDTVLTVIHVSDLDAHIPDFSLEPEKLWTKLSELAFGKDIDFKDHAVFSSQYYLRAQDEDNVRKFFRDNLIGFLETHSLAHVESHRNKLLIYEKRATLSPAEIADILVFVDGFIGASNKVEVQPA